MALLTVEFDVRTRKIKPIFDGVMDGSIKILQTKSVGPSRDMKILEMSDNKAQEILAIDQSPAISIERIDD